MQPHNEPSLSGPGFEPPHRDCESEHGRNLLSAGVWVDSECGPLRAVLIGNPLTYDLKYQGNALNARSVATAERGEIPTLDEIKMDFQGFKPLL